MYPTGVPDPDDARVGKGKATRSVHAETTSTTDSETTARVTALEARNQHLEKKLQTMEEEHKLLADKMARFEASLSALAR